ncbi:MAG: FAD-binding oxidoreductase [Alphaproteobacteria bacterium]|nr:FAD-binding oxidoreductase [Alphaproteobacteria bacterium]
MTRSKPPNLSETARGLARIVPRDRLISDPELLEKYNQEWRGNYRGAAQLVARPQSTAEVAAVVTHCHQAGIGWVVQGGNTGLVGGAVAAEEEIVISFESLNQVRQIDPHSYSMVVEAGLSLAATRRAAEAAGRVFPLMLASAESCTIGGNIATNAGGMQVLRYGMMRDLVLGLEVVLPNGSVVSDLRGLRKANLGLDWKQLFIGTEGRCGIITAACLKLYPPARETVTAWLALRDAAAASAVLTQLREELGELISIFEFLNELSLSMVTSTQGLAHPIAAANRRGYYGLLLVESAAAAVGLEAAVLRAGKRLFESGLATDVVVAQSAAQAATLMQLREGVSEAQSHFGASLKHDVSVPLAQIAEFLEEAELRLTQTVPGIRIVAFGHIGDGNIHYNLTRPEAMTDEQFRALRPAINRTVYDLVQHLGGSFSAEHGIGRLRREEWRHYTAPEIVALVERVTSAVVPAKGFSF